ncbi:MAG: DUF4349 domain-containing protein [Halobacteriota archaeon]|nr:DUF4349 domain-containing protein [Halobacteriota archaeon]
MEKRLSLIFAIVIIIISVVVGSLIIGSFIFGMGSSTSRSIDAMEPYPDIGEKSVNTFSFSESSSDYTVNRMVIKSASLSIEVTDFQASFDRVKDITQNANGFIADSSSYVTGSGNTRGDVTIRVPQDNFNSVIEELKQLGNLKSEQISGEDITEEYIDLNARLNNLERQEERLLEILDLADTVEDILKVEKELGRVRGEIEQITGRIRYLDDRVELSTIRVSIYEPEPITRSWGLRDALRSSVEGFVLMVNSIVIFAGYILPILILIIIAWVTRSRLLPKLMRK